MNIAVLINQLRGCLLANARDAIKIVAWVTTKCRVVGILRWSHTGSLKNSRFVIQRIVTHTALVVQDPNMWILH